MNKIWIARDSDGKTHLFVNRPKRGHRIKSEVFYDPKRNFSVEVSSDEIEIPEDGLLEMELEEPCYLALKFGLSESVKKLIELINEHHHVMNTESPKAAFNIRLNGCRAKLEVSIKPYSYFPQPDKYE